MRNAVLVSIVLLVIALMVRGWLGVVVALAAAAPAGYEVWQGMQGERQGRAAAGIALMLVAVGVSILLAVCRLLRFL